MARHFTSPPADQLAFELPEISPLHLVDQGQSEPIGRVQPSARERVANAAITAPDRVWLVWEDDEVLGVYGDAIVAQADVQTLRRNASHSGAVLHYECLAVPVFTVARHQRAAKPNRRSAQPVEATVEY